MQEELHLSFKSKAETTSVGRPVQGQEKLRARPLAPNSEHAVNAKKFWKEIKVLLQRTRVIRGNSLLLVRRQGPRSG